MMFEWMEHATRIKTGAFIPNPEEKQLLEEASQNQAVRIPVYYQALAAFGRQLSGWGNHLQSRYETASQLALDVPHLENLRKP